MVALLQSGVVHRSLGAAPGAPRATPAPPGVTVGWATLLVIDDDPGVLGLMEQFASGFGFEVVTRTDARAALAEIRVLKPDAVLVDLRMPDVNGLDVLHAIKELDPSCQIIVMTGMPTVDTAMEAVKRGALDYLSKPFDFARLGGLLIGVRAAIERRRRLVELDADVAQRFAFYGMIGRSPVMQELFDWVRRLAPHMRSVLISGETGTGKELVARALHQLGSRRAQRLVTLNCSAVVDTLFESELFGHERGAFTGASAAKVGLFEHADKGTLFLDEIGELPLALQGKLLRAVENGETQRVGSTTVKQVDVAVVAATNRDLRAEVAAGRFRSDLYYRLTVMEVRLVPLRERQDDIPYLCAAFIREMSDRQQRRVAGMTPAAEALLRSAPWPGNVRELRNVIERAVLMSDGKLLGERDVRAGMHAPLPTAGPGPAPNPTMEPPATPRTFDPGFLSAARAEQVQRALAQAGGNKAAAARLLGISRRSMYRWLDLPPPGDR